MHELLTHILDFNPGLKPDQLVLLANIAQADAESLKENPRLRGIQIIVGDFYSEANLRRAAPERARKVMILADRSPQAGVVPSMTEVDARTIMTAMTLANVARGTLVTAEVLDPKMDQYLKLAAVSEIIYSREYSRLLLGNASGGTGIANIIFDLLDPKTPTLINTHEIAAGEFGKAYPDVKAALEAKHPNLVVIGVLENTGNSHRIKELALRQAQKTPDMAKLVKNLKEVKEIRCNHPVFSPARDYVVHEGSMAIVIEIKKQGAQHGHGTAARAA